jgi:hypothetical protein
MKGLKILCLFEKVANEMSRYRKCFIYYNFSLPCTVTHVYYFCEYIGASINFFPTTGQSALTSSCDFESGLSACGYTNGGGIFFWVLQQGRDPASGTGPSGDHTPGLNGRGKHSWHPKGDMGN